MGQVPFHQNLHKTYINDRRDNGTHCLWLRSHKADSSIGMMTCVSKRPQSSIQVSLDKTLIIVCPVYIQKQTEPGLIHVTNMAVDVF